jgi:hypothetical protein
MSFIFSMVLKIRDLWQLRIAIILHHRSLCNVYTVVSFTLVEFFGKTFGQDTPVSLCVTEWYMYPKKVGTDLFNYEFVKLMMRLIGSGLAPSSQSEGSPLRTPWPAKLTGK